MENTTYRPVTVGEWIITYLLMSIPLVNLVLLFVWAFGNNTPASKANWAKALLIMMLFGIILYTAFFLIFGLGMLGLASATSQM
jgi:hypothetical protein